MSVGAQPPQTNGIAGDEVVVITHEDVDRAHDRVRVSEARAHRGFFHGARLLWLLVGPGILVMLSIRNVLEWRIEDLSREVGSLEQYVSNDAPGGD